MIVKWSLSVEGLTRQVFDEFPICLKNSTIGPGKMHAVSVSSQYFMAYFASYRVTEFVRN
jgi:hypothetical protein